LVVWYPQSLKAFDERAILSSIVSRQARRYLRLVDKNTDVNTQGSHFGNALQAASRAGHKAVVVVAA
jgi:hypothetical protein